MGFRGTGRGGVWGFRPVGHPPLRVERHQPHDLPDVDQGGTRAPACGQELGPRVAHRGDEALLPPNRVPSSRPMTIPIVIARYADPARASRSAHAKLRAYAPTCPTTVVG